MWICPDPCGHLQATGVDAAGRRQYLYHPLWRQRRDRRKFGHIRDVAHRLPDLRRHIRSDLADPELSRRRVLALAARLIDLGLFRVGGDQYPTYGVATLRASHVRRDGQAIRFRFAAKGGIERECHISDRSAVAAITALRRHRSGSDRLLAYRADDGWHDIHAADINAYLREASGIEMTAKDLRTWHATVVAAVELSREGVPSPTTAAKRTVARVMRAVAEQLGNTATVARSSYVDPDVVEAYLRGRTIDAARPGPAAEQGVLDLLE